MSKIRATVTIPQAIKICGVSRRTVYNWMDANKVQFVRTPSGVRRIYLDTLHIAGNVAVGTDIPVLKMTEQA